MAELNLSKIRAAVGLLETWKATPAQDRSALTNASTLLVEAGIVPGDVEAAIDHNDIKAAALLIEKAVDDLTFLLAEGRLSRGQQIERELSQEELSYLIELVQNIEGIFEKLIEDSSDDYFYIADEGDAEFDVGIKDAWAMLETTGNPISIPLSSFDISTPEGWKTSEFVRKIKSGTPLNRSTLEVALPGWSFKITPGNMVISRTEISGPNFLIFLELKDYDYDKALPNDY